MKIIPRRLLPKGPRFDAFQDIYSEDIAPDRDVPFPTWEQYFDERGIENMDDYISELHVTWRRDVAEQAKKESEERYNADIAGWEDEDNDLAPVIICDRDVSIFDLSQIPYCSDCYLYCDSPDFYWAHQEQIAQLDARLYKEGAVLHLVVGWDENGWRYQATQSSQHLMDGYPEDEIEDDEEDEEIDSNTLDHTAGTCHNESKNDVSGIEPCDDCEEDGVADDRPSHDVDFDLDYPPEETEEDEESEEDRIEREVSDYPSRPVQDEEEDEEMFERAIRECLSTPDHEVYDPSDDEESDDGADERVSSGARSTCRPIPFGSTAGPRLKRLDVLPPVLRQLAVAVADSVQVSVECVVGFSIGLLAAVLQGRIAVQPKPNKHYIEHLNLYLLLSMPTSSGKSAVLSLLRKPLELWQTRCMQEASELRRSAEIELEEIEKQLSDADNDERGPLTKRKQELELVCLRTGQKLVQDLTPEANARLLYTEGSVRHVVDEVHVATLTGSRWGGETNITLLLQSYTGENYTVNRVSAPPMLIECPLMSIVAGVQPGALESLLRESDVIDRGLAGRILFVVPPLTFGTRSYETQLIPEETWEAYEKLIELLVSLPENRLDPPRLRLSDEAFELIAAFYEKIDSVIGNHVNDPMRVGLLGKLPGNANRLAGILHAVKYADEGAGLDRLISGETMGEAIELARFFASHARVVAKAAAAGESAQRAAWKKITEEELKKFRASELWQALKGSRHFKKMPQLDRAIQGLCERNFLIHVPHEGPKGPGRRPSPVYRVNPLAPGAEYAAEA